MLLRLLCQSLFFNLCIPSTHRPMVSAAFWYFDSKTLVTHYCIFETVIPIINSSRFTAYTV
jgi:hypothetical protein